MALVEAVAVVDNIVDNLGFGLVVLGNGLDVALLLNLVQGFVNHIDGKNRRGVVQ